MKNSGRRKKNQHWLPWSSLLVFVGQVSPCEGGFCERPLMHSGKNPLSVCRTETSHPSTVRHLNFWTRPSWQSHKWVGSTLQSRDDSLNPPGIIQRCSRKGDKIPHRKTFFLGRDLQREHSGLKHRSWRVISHLSSWALWPHSTIYIQESLTKFSRKQKKAH